MIVELIVQFFDMGRPVEPLWRDGGRVWICADEEHPSVTRELHHEGYRVGWDWPLQCPQAQWADRKNDDAMARCLRFGKAAYLASADRAWQQEPERRHWTVKLTCRAKEELVG